MAGRVPKYRADGPDDLEALAEKVRTELRKRKGLDRSDAEGQRWAETALRDSALLYVQGERFELVYAERKEIVERLTGDAQLRKDLEKLRSPDPDSIFPSDLRHKANAVLDFLGAAAAWVTLVKSEQKKAMTWASSNNVHVNAVYAEEDWPAPGGKMARDRFAYRLGCLRLGAATMAKIESLVWRGYFDGIKCDRPTTSASPVVDYLDSPAEATKRWSAYVRKLRVPGWSTPDVGS